MVWTAERHEQAKARCDAATPGPWSASDGVWSDGIEPRGLVSPVWALTKDAEFVAHARQDLPDALAEIERLQARVAELERA